jgi:hypothetical protein
MLFSWLGHRHTAPAPARARGRRRARAAVVQQRHDELAPRGDLASRITQRARRGPARPGWLAHVTEVERAGQHQPARAAVRPSRPS